MLLTLSIRDFVLVDSLNLRFGHGLYVITGETGAGKSVILDAVDFVLGSKAESCMVRQGAERSCVTAEFDFIDSLIPIFEEASLDIPETLIIRRVVSIDGKSKAFINDIPISASFLKKISQYIIEVNGQFEKPFTEIQFRELLDKSLNIQKELTELRDLYISWKESRKILKDFNESKEKLKEDRTYIEESLKELVRINPQQCEESDLAEKRSVLKNHRSSIETIEKVLSHLNNSSINDAYKTLVRSTNNFHPDVITKLEEALDSISYTIDYFENILRDSLDIDKKLEHIEERLFELRDTAKKYKWHPDDLPNLIESFEKRLLSLAFLDNEEDLRKQEELQKQSFKLLGDSISEKRNTHAKVLEKRIVENLNDLRFHGAMFFIGIDKFSSEEKWNEHGIDSLSIKVSTNPGQQLRSIQDNVSGGELARFTLATKVSLAECISVPTVIFDEIDAGTGGSVATAIGSKLKKLAENKVQVITITHAPQVAAFADHHIVIRKNLTDKNATTSASILTKEESTEELARMLSAEEITEEARMAAKSLQSRY